MMFRVLFEWSWGTLGVLLAAAVVALTVWRRRRTRGAGRAAFVTLTAIPVWVGVQAWVVTDGERIAGLCRDVADAAARAEAAAVAARFADVITVGRRGEQWSREELTDAVHRALTVWKIEEPRLRRLRVEMDDEHPLLATASFEVVCRLVGPELLLPRHVSGWRLRLDKSEGTWRVTEVYPVRSEWFPFDSLTEALR